jgi:hypothetical protein
VIVRERSTHKVSPRSPAGKAGPPIQAIAGAALDILQADDPGLVSQDRRTPGQDLSIADRAAYGRERLRAAVEPNYLSQLSQTKRRLSI